MDATLTAGGEAWSWVALLTLGAFHGINPGMGWLFAVALGMQERRDRAVWRALLPLTAGHALAIAGVLVAAAMIGAAIPTRPLQWVVGLLLLALGSYRIVRCRHPRWGGMRVGARDLTIWSFLMASAHGAGLMVLPFVLGMEGAMAQDLAHHHHAHTAAAAETSDGLIAAVAATLIHTLGYLAVTASVAWVVYRHVGLGLLRRAWVNLDLVWAVALVVTGIAALGMAS